VIFPGLTQPIAAGRPSTLRAIESALKSDRLVFAVAQRDNSEEPTADILAGLGERRLDEQTLVGFAAEHGPEGMAEAEGKLAAKHLDALVVNDISREDIGFDVDCNEVTILTAGASGNGVRRVARAAKAQIAEEILDTIGALRAGR